MLYFAGFPSFNFVIMFLLFIYLGFYLFLFYFFIGGGGEGRRVCDTPKSQCNYLLIYKLFQIISQFSVLLNDIFFSQVISELNKFFLCSCECFKIRYTL